MTWLYVVMVIIGLGCFTAGFFVPEFGNVYDRKKEEKKIREMFEKNSEEAKKKFESDTEDICNDSLDKTQRNLEKITNEKIMAVNEYADTVLADINKNHDEAVFLYSMLNDKHEELTGLQSSLDNSAKELRDTIDATDLARDSYNRELTMIQNERMENIKASVAKEVEEEVSPESVSDATEEVSEKKESNRINNIVMPTASPDSKDNHNDEIIAMCKAGKSAVAIAKELGLGVGEVKLVIDLYKLG